MLRLVWIVYVVARRGAFLALGRPPVSLGCTLAWRSSTANDASVYPEHMLGGFLDELLDRRHPVDMGEDMLTGVDVNTSVPASVARTLALVGGRYRGT